MNTREMVSLIVAGCAGLVWAVLEIRRWRQGKRTKQIEEEKGLPPNPTRCADHESRLRGVEQVCHTIEPRLKGIEGSLEDVKFSVQKLVDIHLEK